MTQYNFSESLKRIDELTSTDTGNALPFIPTKEALEVNKTVFVKATVMYVKIETKSDSIESTDSAQSLKLQSFLHEVKMICRGNENCRDLIITPYCAMAIYSTPKKVDVDTVIDDSARVKTLAMVVNKKLEGLSIKTSIGIDYGQLVMTIDKIDDGTISFLWSGKAIKEAKKLAEERSLGQIVITTVIWNNIRQENQRLFKNDSLFEEYFVGNIINVAMNNWVLSNEK